MYVCLCWFYSFICWFIKQTLSKEIRAQSRRKAKKWKVVKARKDGKHPVCIVLYLYYVLMVYIWLGNHLIYIFLLYYYRYCIIFIDQGSWIGNGTRIVLGANQVMVKSRNCMFIHGIVVQTTPIFEKQKNLQNYTPAKWDRLLFLIKSYPFTCTFY